MTKPQNLKFPRRSALFVPGDSLRKLNKATQLGADSVIMDLEDGVALNRKEEARRTVAEALQTLDFGRAERLVRVNPPDSEAFAADLHVTLEGRPDGYVIPKVETVGQVQVLSHHLAKTEYLRNWPSGSIRLLAMIETAQGVMNLKEIAQAGRRLEALVFGAEDLARDIGGRRTRAGWEVFYGRSAVVTAAAAYGLQALDMVFTDLNDLAGLEEECAFGRQLGYDGKTAIHPRQVEIINRVFAPSPEEIEQARRIVAANEAHQASGVGAFELDGQMVDMPIVRAAEQVLARARLVGLIP
jgi:citrate lyase beta subunit